MRWANDGGNEEFLHACATNLVFEEIASIVHSLTGAEAQPSSQPK
jgi:hypothetical protein